MSQHLSEALACKLDLVSVEPLALENGDHLKEMAIWRKC